MKKLYRYYMDCGRMGGVSGVFTAEEEEVKAAIGSRVNFGEILGKHSEVRGVLKEEQIEMLTDDQVAVEVIDKYLGGGTGYDPLDYLRCEHGHDIEDSGCPVCQACPDCGPREQGREMWNWWKHLPNTRIAVCSDCEKPIPGFTG